METPIESLRTFFNVTCAVFEMARTLQIVLNGNSEKTYMHHLHSQAKAELDKENPNMQIVDSLLSIMEQSAENNKKPNNQIMNITDQKNKVRTDVIAHLNKTGTSQRRFAVNAGVDWSDFSKWLKGKKSFSDKSIDLIIKQLSDETQR